MATLATRDLTLGYARQTIIEQLALQLPPGKVSVLIGSNGCGKSTLLRVLALLDRPERGELELRGRRVQHRALASPARVVRGPQPDHQRGHEGLGRGIGHELVDAVVGTDHCHCLLTK